MPRYMRKFNDDKIYFFRVTCLAFLRRTPGAAVLGNELDAGLSQNFFD
jgi:hypothetical protein